MTTRYGYVHSPIDPIMVVSDGDGITGIYMDAAKYPPTRDSAWVEEDDGLLVLLHLLGPSGSPLSPESLEPVVTPDGARTGESLIGRGKCDPDRGFLSSQARCGGTQKQTRQKRHNETEGCGVHSHHPLESHRQLQR